MRYLVCVLLLVSGYSFADESGNVLSREEYEHIIEKQYPGFRIMRVEDFDDMYKGQFHDGKNGSLLIGHFDADENLDFAAYLIGAKRIFESDGKTPLSHGIDIYNGAVAICHGDKQGNYACEKIIDAPHWGREENELQLVPRGSHECMEGGGKTGSITTSFDSIGEYSEKGGFFYVRQSDGKYKRCVNSD
jgi:hypothetical protein